MNILDRFTMWMFKGAIKRNRKFRVAAHKAMLDYFKKEYYEDTVPTKLYIANEELFAAAMQDEQLKDSMRLHPEMYGLGLAEAFNDTINDRTINVE